MLENRRQFLTTSFASVGALGASTMAMSAMAQAAADKQYVSHYGKGPALEGPYLDLRTGRGNQLAYARIQGDLDFGQQKYFWFKGYVMGVEPQKAIKNLVGASGFGVIRLQEGEDGAIRRLCREIIVYTDLRTGEVLQEWKNPLNGGETVKVVHVDNDPFNYLIEDHFPQPASMGGQIKNDPNAPRIPFILPWYQHGDQLAMEVHIHLAYPSALQPDKWPRESAGPVAQVSEFFAHHVKAADMQNPKITSLDYQGTWNRITPWLPWMLMGQRPGQCQYAAFMGTTKDLESVLSKPVLDYAEKHYKKYFDAPTEWSTEHSMSSLEHYARQQKPAPVKKSAD